MNLFKQNGGDKNRRKAINQRFISGRWHKKGLHSIRIWFRDSPNFREEFAYVENLRGMREEAGEGS